MSPKQKKLYGRWRRVPFLLSVLFPSAGLLFIPLAWAANGDEPGQGNANGNQNRGGGWLILEQVFGGFGIPQQILDGVKTVMKKFETEQHKLVIVGGDGAKIVSQGTSGGEEDQHTIGKFQCPPGSGGKTVKVSAVGTKTGKSASQTVTVECTECGDGIVQADYEECDNGKDNGTEKGKEGEPPCSKKCKWVSMEDGFCGDGIVQEKNGEVCDGEKGCGEDCLWENCGNGVVDKGEECDPEDGLTGSKCRKTCELKKCGDGVVDYDIGEECDDENTSEGDGCSSSCYIEYCGDGVEQSGEVCDEGESLNGSGYPHCKKDCSGYDSCGDGNIDAGEQCDDGNNVDGDGCTKECYSEADQIDCTDVDAGNLSTIVPKGVDSTVEFKEETCSEASACGWDGSSSYVITKCRSWVAVKQGDGTMACECQDCSISSCTAQDAKL